MNLKNGSHFNGTRTWGPRPKYERVTSYKRMDNNHIFIAGPCSVEDKNQINTIAKLVKEAGANHLRGGVFRAGTYPSHKFGWVGKDLMEAYSKAARDNGLENIIEILDYSDMDKVLPYANCLQVGARSMQNYSLLKKVAQTGKRVFLKRHPGSTLDEFLGSAEWLLYHGCTDVVLIERGSVGHVNHVRWDLSISMIPSVKLITDIPIIVDASHGTGRFDLVAPMTLAGIAAGADGCLIEVHTDPDNSLSDADQAITPEEYTKIRGRVDALYSLLK